MANNNFLANKVNPDEKILDNYLKANQGQQQLPNEQPQQPVEYPNPAQSVADKIAAMPNADKLSPLENWMYQKLPGFSQSSIGKALNSFSESPAGKILSVLDIGAEGLERTLGLVAQYRNMQPGEEFKLKDAWSAGSLFWDTVRLPRIQYDATGKPVGISMDNTLPGTYALTEARKMLQDGKSMDEVRNSLYNNLGALSLRSQSQDMLGHIAGDPLAWALGALKPVERLHAIRNLALTGKMDVEAVRTLQESAKAAGNLEDAAKYAEAIAKAEQQGKTLSRFDKFAIMITGGTPYTQDVTKMTKGELLLSKLNPLALSPQARASEMLDMVAANVGSYLITPNLTKDPEEFLRVMASAAKGSINGEWGHLAYTTQGRTLQSFLAQSDGLGKVLGEEWQLYSKERNLLSSISQFMGKDERSLWEMASKSPDVLMKQILTAAEQSGNEPLKLIVQSGSVNRDVLEKIGQLSKDIPLMKEEFYAKALVGIQDIAMKQSILQFGIKEKGLLTKWSDALKAWETIPFIRANPANMVRNVINNDMTLIGRGLFGTMSATAIDNFWKGKFIPPQLQRAFAFAGEGEFDAGKATEALIKTLEGDSKSLPQKIKAAAGKVDLGIADFSEKSSNFEARASIRASTNAWIDFHNRYWNPRTGFTSITKTLNPDVIDEMEKVVPGITQTLDEVAQSAGADSAKFSELMKTNIDHNVTTILKNAEDGLNYKLDDVLGAETIQAIKDGLPKAIQDGNVKGFINGLRDQMEAHVDEMFNKHIENLPGIVAAQVQAGGQFQFQRIFSKSMDEFWAGNTEHAIRMSGLNELMDYAKSTGNYEKVGEMWNRIFQDGENHFSRIWKKMDAYQAGLKEGALNAGVKYPEEVSTAFKDMQSGWKEFFDFRNSEYQKFFDAQLKGKEYSKTLDSLQNEITNRFEKMSTNEDSLYQRIDDMMAKAIKDPAQKTMYVNFRDQVGKLRQADRTATKEFYAKLRTATGEEAPNLWSQYWKDRVDRIEQIRQMELQGSAAMQGDPNAIKQFFTPQSAGNPQNIFELASQYGISSAGGQGVRNDNRILNTVNKYIKESGATKVQIIQNATLPEDVKTTYSALADAEQALKDARKARAGVDIASGTQALDAEKAAKDAMKTAKQAYEEALAKNNIDPKAIAKLETFMNAKDIPMEIAQKAFDARAAEKTTSVTSQVEKSFIPDAEKIFQDPMPIETALSEMNYGRSYAAMDSIAEEAFAQAKKKSALLTDLPQNLQDEVMKWSKQVEDNMAGFRSAATQYSAFRRDSALLNYNRRTNFDTWIGHVAPFAFWTTHSMANWVIYSVDRPSMMASYFRTRKFFETAGLSDQNIPSRLKGQIRVNLPFAPKWMGDQFVDPLRTLLPMSAFLSPWEQAQTSKFTQESKAKETLQQMLEQGQISEQDYNSAVNSQSGDAWDLAMAKVQEGGDNYDAMDFVNMTMTPHAPLMWAYNAVRGQPNEIGAFTPMTRTVKNFATMMGVKDWSNSPYNIEARVRKEMGLPAYDKWDNYRIGREIANMAADGGQDMEKVKEAMQFQALVEAGKMQQTDAEAQSELYKEAVYRSNQEYAGGITGTLAGLLGIPVHSFPTGEQAQRDLADQFAAAYKQYDGGNGDPKALTDFFDKHPEYEARLALFKSPDERLKSFMVDNVWSRWNELPKVNQDEIKSQLGDSFANNFLNKETRNYDSVDPLQLQVWLKLIGGKPVGTLTADQNVMAELNQIKLTDPTTAWRVQTFYDMRTYNYPDWFKLQNQYYAIGSSDGRKAFLAKNPQLKEYFNSRTQWMQKNPDLVRFLTDDQKTLAKYANVKRNPQVAIPTRDEVLRNFSPAAQQLITDWQNGQELPQSVSGLLQAIAYKYGISNKTMMGILTNRTTNLP